MQPLMSWASSLLYSEQSLFMLSCSYVIMNTGTQAGAGGREVSVDHWDLVNGVLSEIFSIEITLG